MRAIWISIIGATWFLGVMLGAFNSSLAGGIICAQIAITATILGWKTK